MFTSTQPIRTGSDWFVAKPVLAKSIEWQYGILAVMSVLALAALVYAAWQVHRTKRTDALWICLGAALASFWEPLGDLLAHVTYHEVDQLNLTTSFGFHTPLWILPTYVVFFGAPILLLLAALERGLAPRTWMALFVASLPGAFLFEVPLLKMGAIDYYGANQPLQILGYPLWMAFANSATMFLVTTTVHFLRRADAVRRRPWLLAPVLPMLVLGANGGAGLPLASAINGGGTPGFVESMAVLSMALSTLYVWLCGQLVAPAGPSMS